jgi:glycosyltransferase involved in cell wall biosynthesis
LAPYKNTKDFCMSYPNKPIEYFSAGLPVISSLTGDLEQLLGRYQCGLTYKEKNPASLREILNNLMATPEHVHQMGTNASALFQQRFRAEQVYLGMKSHLEDIVANFTRSKK